MILKKLLMIQEFIKPFKMKKINQLLVIVCSLFIIILIPSCGSKDNTESVNIETEVSAANLMVVDYAIEGMVCAMGCAATIQEELLNMDGVVNCTVDFEATKAHIEFDKSKLSEVDIITKIESIADGQYKVSKWNEKVESTENVEQNANEDGKETVEDETKVKVNLPSFQIPNLFTFLINQV